MSGSATADSLCLLSSLLEPPEMIITPLWVFEAPVCCELEAQHEQAM